MSTSDERQSFNEKLDEVSIVARMIAVPCLFVLAIIAVSCSLSKSRFVVLSTDWANNLRCKTGSIQRVKMLLQKNFRRNSILLKLKVIQYSSGTFPCILIYIFVDEVCLIYTSLFCAVNVVFTY